MVVHVSSPVRVYRLPLYTIVAELLWLGRSVGSSYSQCEALRTPLIATLCIQPLNVNCFRLDNGLESRYHHCSVLPMMVSAVSMIA